MADIAPSPTPEQAEQKRRLDMGRLQSGRLGKLGRSMALAGALMGGGAFGGGLPNAPENAGRRDRSAEQTTDKGQQAVSKGLDALSNAPDPRVAMAARGAKAIGADKMLAQNKTVRGAAELASAAQSGDLKAAVRAGGKLWKDRVLWPTFFANVMVEPLSAFFFTFTGIQIYTLVGFMMGEDIVEPSPVHELVAIVVLSCFQVIVVLGVLMMGYVVFCLTSPLCATEVLGEALAKQYLEPLGIKF